MARSTGVRAKTRHKLQGQRRHRFKVTQYFKSFETGDHVSIRIDPSYQKSMPHPKFHGYSGVVTGRRGSVYEVSVREGKQHKTLYVHPVHLR